MEQIEPVVLFVFNRPETTRKVWSEICKAKPSNLLVVADGPRQNKVNEDKLIQEVRQITKLVDWPCSVEYLFAATNLGLRQNLLQGLDYAFQLFDRAIILEDDCLPSSDFFSFSSMLLRRFDGELAVGTVAGTNFAPGISSNSYHFSRAPYIWGWATWARVWKEFREGPQVEEWTKSEIKNLSESFAHPCEKRTFTRMMKSAKSLNTWDISFAVWMRQRQLLSAIPKYNLVSNIGFGASATHTKFEPFDIHIGAQSMEQVLIHPNKIEADDSVDKLMWRSKTLKWFSYPFMHPLDFSRRMLNYGLIVIRRTFRLRENPIKLESA